MSNPRPCVCGHRPGHHIPPESHSYRPCLVCRCATFRDAPRKEPLRARRGRTRVVLRPSTEPAQSWSEGVRVWTQADVADLGDKIAPSPEPSAEFRLSDGRVLSARVEWKEGRWHVHWPPEADGQAVMQVRIHGSA